MKRVLLGAFLTVAAATAHDLQVRQDIQGRAVIVEARYAGTEPCAYAAVTIFSPADTRSEYQNGRTDASGNFSFVPNQPGTWKFIVDDEIGHRQELLVVIGDVAAGTSGAAAQPPWQKALTGGALIAGLTGVLYGWKSRRPRKLALTLAVIVIISSTAPGAWTAFSGYGMLVAALAAAARVAPSKLAIRWRLGTPFLVMAATLMFLAGIGCGGTILLKGYLALTMLTILVETTPTAALIGAIRRMGAPESVNLVAALMVRYIAMLEEEFGRMSRARLARAGGPLAGAVLFEVHGNQIGLLLIRSWERAERIHLAMLARGFTGAMPDLYVHRFSGKDGLLLAAASGLFLTVRFLFQH